MASLLTAHRADPAALLADPAELATSVHYCLNGAQKTG